jgi:hypothetical protein
MSHEMTHAEKERYRNAAKYATQAFPGAIGEALAQYIHAYADFGYNFSQTSLPLRVIDQVVRTPLPVPADLPENVA